MNTSMLDYTNIVKALASFQIESKKIYSYLKTEEKITLNFSGYTKTISKSETLDSMNLIENLAYMRELNMWIAYFNDLQCVIKKTIKKEENQYAYLEAFRNPKRENKKLKLMESKSQENHNKLLSYQKKILQQIRLLNLILNALTYATNENCKKYNR